ncbi:alpha-L-arabinofuranosidase C-terminal domain-containing protein [Niabella aquatica]
MIFKANFSFAQTIAPYPDSVYLFAYSPVKPNDRTGLAFAWSSDGSDWNAIGPEHYFVYSDYGAWGSQKKMHTPYLFQGTDGVWHLVWSLNDNEDVFAYAASKDLVDWGRQSYPQTKSGHKIINPVISRQASTNSYAITWQEASGSIYLSETKDFKNYLPVKSIPSHSYNNNRAQAVILGQKQTGTLHKVPYTIIEGLINAQQKFHYQQLMNSETAAGDDRRFAGLKPVDITLTPQPAASKKISELLVGAFFEDINYAADGGLYGELIQNRDFEYHPSDKKYQDKSWNSTKAWRIGLGNLSVDTVAPIHKNNPHYAVLSDKLGHPVLINEGFGGIAVQAGASYDCSAFIRIPSGKAGTVTWKLADKNGKILGTATMKVPAGKNWNRLATVITAGATAADAELVLVAEQPGMIHLDMVSLFPKKTFKNRKNGLRADLAQALADMKPKFLRFPGGCVAHGDGIANIYRWKNTIGPLEARKPMRNLWNYHQTMGLGYYEYFQYCEDIAAEPLPVLAAGVPCQNSSTGGAGQQGGIPIEEMDEYIQDILDLVEWANGDAQTSKWAKLRAEAGHPKPFNLKYIGIGNEDLITDIFEERFTMIFNAIKEKYPEIKVVGTSGPFFEGTDYVEGWGIARKLGVDLIDEHYYVTPGWFIHNQDYYDKYDRNGSKVYLGEYASHLPGKPNNLETALSEALHLNNIERNGDIVAMTSYAPLFAKEGNTQWNPDMIYFTNTEVKLTPGYHVQRLYGNYAGDTYIPSEISYSNNTDGVVKRISASIVKNTKTNELFIRMVNMLPVNVNITLNSDMIPSGAAVQKTVLTGAPGDTKVKPAESMGNLQGNRQEILPPYSLTMWKVKGL